MGVAIQKHTIRSPEELAGVLFCRCCVSFHPLTLLLAQSEKQSGASECFRSKCQRCDAVSSAAGCIMCRDGIHCRDQVPSNRSMLSGLGASNAAFSATAPSEDGPDDKLPQIAASTHSDSAHREDESRTVISSTNGSMNGAALHPANGVAADSHVSLHGASAPDTHPSNPSRQGQGARSVATPGVAATSALYAVHGDAKDLPAQMDVTPDSSAVDPAPLTIRLRREVSSTTSKDDVMAIRFTVISATPFRSHPHKRQRHASVDVIANPVADATHGAESISEPAAPSASNVSSMTTPSYASSSGAMDSDPDVVITSQHGLSS